MSNGSLWIFGYGSLIFRPGFQFEERSVGRVRGYQRRFWQASTDHRGTPERPGRVVTLVAGDSAECWGVAYKVPPHDEERVVAELEVREQGGYDRIELPFEPQASGRGPKTVSVYVGHTDNPQFRGPEDEEAIAAIVREAEGPSGHNVEYVLKLAEALDQINVFDPHVFHLANLLTDPDNVLSDD